MVEYEWVIDCEPSRGMSKLFSIGNSPRLLERLKTGDTTLRSEELEISDRSSMSVFMIESSSFPFWERVIGLLRALSGVFLISLRFVDSLLGLGGMMAGTVLRCVRDNNKSCNQTL